MGSWVHQVGEMVTGQVTPALVWVVLLLVPLVLLTVAVCVAALLALRAPDRGSREHSLLVMDRLIGYGRVLIRRR